MRNVLIVALLFCSGMGAGAMEAVATSPEYVTPESVAPESVAHSDGAALPPVFRRLVLTPDVPEDLVVLDSLRRGSLRFAQWRYGSPSSARVAMMILARSALPGDFELYVDLDRDRTISAAELVPGVGNIRQAALTAEWAGAETSSFQQRIVRARYDGGDVLELATLGFLTQQVQLGSRQLAVRVVDGDANGLWADQADRIWIDLDADGKWSPFREQFPVRPFLFIDGVRYALNISPLEPQPLRLVENSGVGRVRAVLPFLNDSTAAAQLDMLEVMLVSDDGSACVIDSVEDRELPTGTYHIGSLMISLRSPGATHPLNFVFAGAGAKGTRRFTVRADTVTEVDVVGKLRFDLEVRTQSGVAAADYTLAVDPRLYTEDDLLITTCWRGLADRATADVYSNSASIAAVSGGKTVGRASSGFA